MFTVISCRRTYRHADDGSDVTIEDAQFPSGFEVPATDRGVCGSREQQLRVDVRCHLRHGTQMSLENLQGPTSLKGPGPGRAVCRSADDDVLEATGTLTSFDLRLVLLILLLLLLFQSFRFSGQRCSLILCVVNRNVDESKDSVLVTDKLADGRRVVRIPAAGGPIGAAAEDEVTDADDAVDATAMSSKDDEALTGGHVPFADRIVGTSAEDVNLFDSHR